MFQSIFPCCVTMILFVPFQMEMESFLFSKDEILHNEIINDSYNGYVKTGDMKLLNLHLHDNSTIVGINSFIFRIFSPLLNSILCDTLVTDVHTQDILLPDFSAEVCRHLIEILRSGKTSVDENSKLDQLRCLAGCLGIDMNNMVLSSDSEVKISSISQMFVESNVPNLLHEDLEDGEINSINSSGNEGLGLSQANLPIADVRNNNSKNTMETTGSSELQRLEKKVNYQAKELEEIQSKNLVLKKENKEITKECREKSKGVTYLQSKVDDLEAKLKSKTKEVTDLDKQVYSLKHKVSEYYWKQNRFERSPGKDSEYFHEESRDLLREIAVKGKEIIRLRRKVDEAKADADKLSVKLKESEKSLDLEEEKKRSLSSSLIVDLRKVEDELKANKKKLEASKEECNTLKKEIYTLKEENNILKKENCDLTLENITLKQEVNPLKEENNTLIEEIDSVKAGNIYLIEKKNILKQDNDTLKEENDKLKKDAIEVTAALESIEQEVERYKNSQNNDLVKDALNQENKNLKVENSTMKQFNDALIKENDSLKKEWYNLKQENEKMKKDDTEAKIALLQEEVNLYKNAKPNDLIKELDKAKANSETLCNELSEAKKRIKQLEQTSQAWRGYSGIAVNGNHPFRLSLLGVPPGLPHPPHPGPRPGPSVRFNY